MTIIPRFFVAGASGRLGRLVVYALARRVGPDAVVAITRDPSGCAELFPMGVAVRQGDYDRPDTLDAAFDGAERLLLISVNAFGDRVAQHRNAIDAAKRAGVGRLAYTSALRADRTGRGLAEQHYRTERLIEESGIPFTLLRNGWYTENYTASIPTALREGALFGMARDGRIASAARRDYAEAAAAALIGDSGAGAIYELAGDQSYTLMEFAAELSSQANREIPYVNLCEEDYRAMLVGAGLPEALAALVAESEAAAATGALFDDSRQLSRLIGRPTTPFAATIGEALKLC